MRIACSLHRIRLWQLECEWHLRCAVTESSSVQRRHPRCGFSPCVDVSPVAMLHPHSKRLLEASVWPSGPYAFLQWGMQVIAQRRAGLAGLRLPWLNPFKETGISEVLAVVVPAAMNSGLTQVATFTDLYFASFIPDAAAALGALTLSLNAVMIPLARPIVQFTYQRRSFDAAASSMVSSLVLCCGSGFGTGIFNAFVETPQMLR